MIERENIPYLYGKLNEEVKKNTYTGRYTQTTRTTVDNENNEIFVDILDAYDEHINSLIASFLQEHEIIIDSTTEEE